MKFPLAFDGTVIMLLALPLLLGTLSAFLMLPVELSFLFLKAV